MTLSEWIGVAGIVTGLLSSGTIIGAIITFGTMKSDIKHLKDNSVLPSGRAIKTEVELLTLRMGHAEKRLETGDNAFIAIRKEQQELREGFIGIRATMRGISDKLTRLLQQNNLLWKALPPEVQARARAEVH